MNSQKKAPLSGAFKSKLNQLIYSASAAVVS